MRYLEKVTHAEETIEQIWFLLSRANVPKAKEIGENLVQDILSLEKDSEPDLCKVLAHACHATGYMVGMSVRYTGTRAPIVYFEEMQRAARRVGDDSLVVIALTYQGDMYRRAGNYEKAKECLKRAYAIPQQDLAAHGNCAQLLGRLSSQIGEEAKFESMMSEAEEIAREIDQYHNSLHGQYSLGTVYIDYSKHYNKMGETRKAFDYFAKAEEALPDMPHWNTLVKATKGLLLVRINDLEQGMPYIMEAIQLAQKHGNYRLLDHFYNLQNDLAHKAIAFNRASLSLDEALHGSPAH
jgi:tetratricopeptide (TPR) repeat protein